ncbi:hypothetical protein [Actinoplanes philippinensis]
MRKRPFLTALGSIAALATSVLALASAANPDQMSNPIPALRQQVP